MAGVPDILKDVPLRAVQVEALVVMKVIKHCAQTAPSPVTGFLVGMDKKATLEVTNAFAYPTIEVPPPEGYHDHTTPAALASTAPRAKANGQYQEQMISKLKEVNVDANCVGWYSSINMGQFVHSTFIENQLHFQREPNERTVALVHDISRSCGQGNLSLRAFRLAPSFMAAIKENKFTTETLLKSTLRYQDILIELPIHVHNSHLLTSFLHSLPQSSVEPMTPQAIPPSLEALNAMSDPLHTNYAALNLSVDPFLEQTTEQLLDSIETHHVELNNYQYYQRQTGREQAKINAWQLKRKAENATRALAKQPALPEDEWQRLFKLPQEPSRLETMLNSRQIEQYARQIDAFTAGASSKMFATRGNLLPVTAED